MDKSTLLGLSKAIETFMASEKTRDSLSAGKHEINEVVTLHIQGHLNVGEDFEATATSSIPWKTALALFVRYSGVTGDVAMEALVRAMNEAQNAGEKPEKTISELAELDKAKKIVDEKLASMPKIKKHGIVKSFVTFKEIDSND